MLKTVKYPPVAVEIGEGYASAVRLEGGSKPVISNFKMVELPHRTADEGNQWNAFKLDERFQEGMSEIADWIGKEKGISISLPDLATRSFFITLENDSANPKEMRDLILFKVQKFAPISTEGTTVDYMKINQGNDRGGKEYLVLLSSRAIVASYEKFFSQRNIQVGNVEAASLVSLNLLGRGGSSPLDGGGTFVLARIDTGHFTLSVFNNYKLVFMRTRVINDGGTAPERIFKEIRTLRLFVEDRLNATPYDAAYFYGPGAALDEAYEKTSSSGLTSARLELDQFIDVPNELLQHREYQGRFFAAASAAARSI